MLRALIAVSAVGLAWTWTSPVVTAQLSQTIAYQGYLADNEGVALDGSFEISFLLFDAESGGTELWSETQANVPIEQGVFSVQLGSVEPLSGFTLDEPIFLEILFGEGGTVLSPRVPLTAVPYSLRSGSLDEEALVPGDNIEIERDGEALRISASGVELQTPSSLAAPDGTPDPAVVIDNNGRVGIGLATNEIVAPLHVSGNPGFPIGLPAGAVVNPGIVVESGDATVGIYSSEAGTFGSALDLGEINRDAGTLVDKWSLGRETTSGGGGLSRLRFTYGSNPNYSVNPTVMTLAPSGFIGIGTDDPEHLLHIRSGGDAELIVEADESNVVGSENRNPALRLRQDGNLVNGFVALEGEAGTLSDGTLSNAMVIGSEDNDPALQFVTDDAVRMTIGTDGAITAPPRTQTLRLTALSFVPTFDHYDYRRFPKRLEVVGEQQWYAPVHLPDGAVVTSATSSWFDARTPDFLFIRLLRQDQLSPGDIMAILTSTGSGGDGTRTDESIQNATVDNGRYLYYVWLQFPAVAGINNSTFAFNEVIIEYTTTRIH